MLSPFWTLSQIGVSFSPPAAIGFQPIYTDAETKFAKEPLHSWFTTSITQGPYCALSYVHKMISLLLVEMSMIWRPLVVEVDFRRAYSLICVILSFRLRSCKGMSPNTVLFQTELIQGEVVWLSECHRDLGDPTTLGQSRNRFGISLSWHFIILHIGETKPNWTHYTFL